MRFLRNKYFAVWVFGALAASIAILVFSLPGLPVRQLNTVVFDTYQRLKPRIWAGSDVVIVDIDEASLKALGQWPWPRTTLADLTDRLGRLGAAAIVFDMVFSEPDRTTPLNAVGRLRKAGAVVRLPRKIDLLDNDLAFATAIARNTVVTGLVLSAESTVPPPPPKAGTGFSGTVPANVMKEDMGAIRNLFPLDRAAAGIGEFGFDLLQQNDAVVRRAPLLNGANGQWYPSLAMEALRVVQGAGSFKLKSNDGSGEFGGSGLALVSAQVGALEVPTDAQGAIFIYHSEPQSKPVVSAIDVLSPTPSADKAAALQAEIANHIVLVGTSAAGLLDLRATPLAPAVAGVTVHADIIDQIIAQDHLSRPDIAPGVELLLSIIGVLILLALMPILNSLFDTILAGTLAIAVIAGCWVAFASYGLLFSPAMPLLCIASAFGAAVAANQLFTEREGRFVRQAFGRYLAPAMVERLAEDPTALKLGGEDRELTILFCDIRGFTGLSEGLDPTELTELLNDFLTPMTDALLKRGATIDKYMGDAIMAFWNAPIDQPDHRQRACEGLLAMRRELISLNRRAPRPIQIGIGLNTGHCCVGNLGSDQRFNYSAIGDAVNVASRIEGLTKQYGLDNLVSAETLNGLTGDYESLVVDLVTVVGRTEPLTVATLLDPQLDSIPDRAGLFDAHEALIDGYRRGDVEEARRHLSLARRASGDTLVKLYDLYELRLKHLRDDGIPDDWDGVFRAQKK